MTEMCLLKEYAIHMIKIAKFYNDVFDLISLTFFFMLL